MLRPYQQNAVDAAKAFLSKCYDPCIIDAATGAGKSHIIAELAQWIHETSNKRVLCLAPSKELVEQNHGKYIAAGGMASLYSASTGQKSLEHYVVFGTPGTVKNSLERFKNFAAVIVDEAHGITPTIKFIIDDLRAKNPQLRVLGLSATPYRLGSGYIYQLDENDRAISEHETVEPYFKKLVFKIGAKELIDQGYLTPPTTERHNGYDTTGLELNSMGKFDARQVEQAFEGEGRKTAAIIAEVVELSAGRKGVMIFAATVPHAKEVMQSLPRGNSALVTGETPKAEREQILKAFKARQIKYLVNVSVLTTGFDASHVDVIAILRATESVGLMQQIIGRGLRIDPGKQDCLVLDYAENIERHCPDGDVFNPNIKAYKSTKVVGGAEVECPDCNYINEFSGRPNPDQFHITKDGYFADLAGVKLEIPSHFGRRCHGEFLAAGTYARCEHRWASKECEKCQHANDVAARYCEKCKGELIDPNEKLVMEFRKLKSDPYAKSTDKVLSWHCQEWISKSGNQTLKVDYTTEYRSFSIWYMPEKVDEWESLSTAVFSGRIAPSIEVFLSSLPNYGVMPKTLTLKKMKEKGFYKIYGHNEALDEIPEIN